MVSGIVVKIEVAVDAFSEIFLVVVDDSVMASDKVLVAGKILGNSFAGALVGVLVVVAVSEKFKYYHIDRNCSFQTKYYLG